jgi:hypothetical protein
LKQVIGKKFTPSYLNPRREKFALRGIEVDGYHPNQSGREILTNVKLDFSKVPFTTLKIMHWDTVSAITSTLQGKNQGLNAATRLADP